MGIITASRYHDFSSGHRVVGHENKCRHFHGHNYRVHFHVEGQPDEIGRVLDFGVIKELLCEWLEVNWDHKMILWENDPVLPFLDHGMSDEELSIAYEGRVRSGFDFSGINDILGGSVVTVPFNPTAENMAQYLVEEVAPLLLPKHLLLRRCVVEETRKCAAEFTLTDPKPHPMQ